MFVNCPSDAMPSQFRHDRKPSMNDFSFHLSTDVAGAKTDPRNIHRSPKRSFGTSHQVIGSTGDFADADCHCGIRKKSVFHGDKVELDKIAFPQGTPARHSVNCLVINADANGAWKPVHLLWRSLRPM